MFAVSTLFGATYYKNGCDCEEPLFEEIVFLIDADDEDTARIRCEKRCITEESEFKFANEELVEWKFKQILHVSALDEVYVDDGVEIFSRFLNKKQSAVLSECAFE